MPDETTNQLEFHQCEDAVRRLTDFLSRELPDNEQQAVERHLHECRGCFARFHFEQTLLQTIQGRLREVQVPPTLRERILTDLRASSRG